MSLPIVGFGKYKGRPVDELIADRKYYEWCKSQPGIVDKNPNIFNITINQTINNSNIVSKTPEHNFMQNMFLDKDMQLKLLNFLFPLSSLQNYVQEMFDTTFKFYFNDECPIFKHSIKESKFTTEGKFN